MRKLSDDEMEKVVDYLNGTCLSLEEGLSQALDEDLDMSDLENEMEFCNFLDNRIFNCAKCGWWCEAGDWITDEDPNWDPSEETCTQCGDC